MVILGIDTAGAACSVAVCRDGAIAARRHAAMARGHAEALLPMTAATLADAGLGFTDLSAVAVAVGPGSFTGLRTGLAAAKGIALARGVPLAGVTRFAAVVFAAPTGETPLMVALETRRADFYVQLFTGDGTAASEPAALAPEAAGALPPPGPFRLAGDAAPRLLAALDGRAGDATLLGESEPGDAAAVALIAWRDRARLDASAAVRPLYLHPAMARLPEAGGRMRP